MKTTKLLALFLLLLHFSTTSNVKAQMPLPPTVPIWDANKVELKLQKITVDTYAIIPTTAEAETSKGIPQATTGGFIIGEKGVLLIEVMMTKRLYDQQIKLIRSVTDKPILFAVNTSDHGDHCFSNYLLPEGTLIIQNEFAKENLATNYEGIKQFMVMLFGTNRGIENTVYRPADIVIPKNSNLKLDLGKGKIIEFMNVGTAQSPADLFVWMPSTKVFWAGNPFIAESPAIPWLFDGFFLEPVENLKKVYNFLPTDAIVIPGHGRITNKAGIKYTIDYVEALKLNIEKAVANGLTLEQAKASIKMDEFNKGYTLFNWLHFNFNLPNAYKDISSNPKK
ncbi:MBL fold metallo-hydrolase [Pedobacter sp. ISL-68]|uniref:MBL fold metallo-hydrolase n=1 Tax=unclassified Pedobacter TaxID=2628915 RepID=UPI001BE7D191|nr:MULTISPECIES: MBL fold metallo-hydrolase [unclassified Pedobacter]MBT2560642.1 MBL fold metallo-hydrolase [Pedobacter sp. ISL-64]MBT2590021.1 MBL fold metallo-hydrolase [Pedobacter sp. ISL-68]